MTIDSWLLFLSIAFVVALTPGPAVLLVSAHSLEFGPKRAIATILGNITGLLVMCLLSVLGLSTLLMYSSIGFTVLKFIGAAYLIYLGIKLWRSGLAGTSIPGTQKQRVKTTALYRQGVLIALTNPKAIMFTSALFPQFIVPTAPLALQFTILVSTFMAMSFVCLIGYAYAAHGAKSGSGKLSGNWTSKFFGGALVSAGIGLAFSTQK